MLSSFTLTSLVAATFATSCLAHQAGIPILPELQVRAYENSTGSHSSADLVPEQSTRGTSAAATPTTQSTRTARPFGNANSKASHTSPSVQANSASPTARVQQGSPASVSANSRATSLGTAASAAQSAARAEATWLSKPGAYGATGGYISVNVGNDIDLNYTAPDREPSNHIIDANIKQNRINGFMAQTLGNNANAIGSWFRTNNSADYTNGHSWCYNVYNDSMPGFAPSFRTMTTNYGGDPIRAGEAYCGLEAIFYLPNGKTKILYVVDAFDDAWVKTPTSTDIVIDIFADMLGSQPSSKNDVMTGVTWAFTGNRSTNYVFNGGRSVNSASTARTWVAPNPTGPSVTGAESSSSSSSSSGSKSNSESSSSSSSSSSGTFSGIATYFYQNGTAGNCGKVFSDSTPLVALPTKTYGSGSNCGRTVHICATSNGACVNAIVADSCPTCGSATDLDLSLGAYQALGHPLSDGTVQMTWSYTD